MSTQPVKGGLDELFDYKNRLIGDIVSTPSIVSLLTDDPVLIKNPEKLVYTQVFPWEKVPGPTEEANTYICCEVDIKRVYDRMLLEPVIYVWAFNHESLHRLPGGRGVRYDALSSEIVRKLNGSRMYGLGEMELTSTKKLSPIDHYEGRTLVFGTKDFNRIFANRNQPIPSSRKW